MPYSIFASPRRRAVLLSLAISLAYVPVIDAQQCSTSGGGASQGLLTDPMYGYQHFGGVSLDKTLTLLNEVDDIKAAAYDPAKQQVVFIGSGTVPVAERIEMDDLVVAIRSVFGEGADPGMTFFTGDPLKSQASGNWDVTYFGKTQSTAFGKVMCSAPHSNHNLSQIPDQTI